MDANQFKQVLEATPLVSIDLIVFNNEEKVLLGLRKNRPAQGFWFVPGGRIFKNETLSDAFKRLTLVELGQEHSIEQASLLGAFDHIYDDSVFGEEITTHYVALGYQLHISDLSNLPLQQHTEYRWLSISELLGDKETHRNVKKYFFLVQQIN